MTIRDYTFLISSEFAQAKERVTALHDMLAADGSAITDADVEAAAEDYLAPEDGDVHDYLVVSPMGVQYRCDWLKMLEARYTSIIPPERRVTYRELHKASKHLAKLARQLAGSTTLDELLRSARDRETFNALRFTS